MAISDEISRLQSAKNSIKIAIGLKGITIPDSVTLSHYDTYISQIKTQGQYEIKTITPNALGQVVMPSEGYDALSQVIINGDLNLTPQNIANGVTIFGVTGNLQTTSKLQHKSVTPNASGQMVMPDDGFDGLSSVSISGDSNLNSENIKKGVSIFGVAGEFVGSETGGGGAGFNVYAQSSEPSSKDGVWLKVSGSSSGSAKFYDYSTATGEVLEAEKFSFIDVTGMGIIAQEIIDGEMYLLTNNNTSKKINLETKTVTTLKSTTFSASDAVYCGSCYYKGLIYIFAANSHYFYWKYYDIGTDTFSAEYTSGYFSSIGTSPANDTRAGVHVFDGKAYVFFLARDYIGGEHVFYAKFDLEKNTYSGKQSWSFSGAKRYSSISGYGQYVYFIFSNYSTGGNSYLRVVDVVNNTCSAVTTFAGSGAKVPFATADAVYAFEGTGGAQKSYMKYDLLSKTIETITASNTYFVAQTYTVKPIMLNDKNGILYFRAGTASGMQFLPSPELDDLSVGSVAVIQSPNNNSVKIQDGSNLHIGVDNVYLKTISGLTTGPVFLGDGVKWSVLKNPTGETAVVTFNTNGGGTIESQEVVIGQKLSSVAEPKKDGYAFIGWYKNGSPFDFNTPIVDNVTLTAVYEQPTFIDNIKSDGTQYINTGIPANVNLKVVADVTPFKNGYPFGVAPAQNTKYYGFALSSTSGNVQAYFGTTGNSGSYPIVSDLWSVGTRCTLIANDGKKFYYNNTLIADFNTTNNTLEFDTTPITIFALNGLYLGSRISMLLHSFQMYDNGDLVRDFKPAITGDGIYCLYDTVTCKYFHNSGTGEFTGGNIGEATTLNYIESTGTQFIDTEFNPNQNTKFEIDFEFIGSDNSNTSAWIPIMGSRTNTNDFYCLLINKTTKQLALNFAGIDTTGITGSETNTRATALIDGCSLYKNGTLLYSGTTTNFTAKVPIILFGMYNKTAVETRGIFLKIYSCKIYDGDTLVRDFIPYRDEFGVVCLYDKVENKAYYNAGTGNFVAG